MGLSLFNAGVLSRLDRPLYTKRGENFLEDGCSLSPLSHLERKEHDCL